MRILVCDDSPEFFLEALQALQFQINYHPKIDNKGLADLQGSFEAILIKSSLVLDETFFTHNPLLKWVFRPGSGLDNVDLKVAEKLGVSVLNSPEGNCDAVGEHALGLLLNLLNNIPRSLRQVKNFEWIREQNRGVELGFLNVAIIGLGHTGSAFYRKLSGFGSTILPHDKYIDEAYGVAENFVGLPDVYENADVVSLHLPLNEETRFYANDEFFWQFKKPIYFLNTSRGGVLNEAALLRAIEAGWVKAAALDVLQHEPISKYVGEEENTLKQLMLSGKVLITPHIAGWTYEAKRKMFQILLDKYLARQAN